MKTFDNFYNEIISLPNLYRAFETAKKGKKKGRVISFEKNLHDNLWELYCELKNKIYVPKSYFTFYVTDYKKRKIMCPHFRDSVVQHAVFIYLEQIYEPQFIYDSYACRKGKGTHKASKRLKSFINKNSNQNYFMKCDISKYFYSIDHYQLKLIIEKTVKDKNVFWLISQIIDSHYEDVLPSHIYNNKNEKQEKGIPIGNLTSQLFANIYLNELDNFIKHELKIKYYLRYVDDFVILGRSYKELQEDFLNIQKFLSDELFLRLEKRKTQINKIFFGIDFTGYVCFKQVVRVRSRNFRRFIKQFKKKVDLFYKEELSLEKLFASVVSYAGHLSHTNSKKILEFLVLEYYNVIARKAVQRGGNWNNGANAGPFCANLNNNPTNTNNNIGFRCCSVQEAKIISSRRCCLPNVQMQLHSETIDFNKSILNENLSRNVTDENSVISAMIMEK